MKYAHLGRSLTISLTVFLLLLAVDGTSHSSRAHGDSYLSLAQAWDKLEVENDAIKAAQAEVQQAEHQQKGAKALRLPSVSLSAGYLYLDDDVQLSPQDLFDSMEAGGQASQLFGSLAASYGLSPAELNSGLTSTIAERSNIRSSLAATWPIFTGGRINAAQEIAAASVREGRQDLRLESLIQFEHLVKYYFGAVLAEQVLETRKAVEAALKKHMDHAVLLEQQGQIAKVERMQSEVSFDKAVVDRKKAQRDLEIARVALTKILKSPAPVIPTDKLFLADSLPDIEHFVSDTLANYPGLDLLDAKKKQAQGVARMEKGKFFPTVSLFGNYSIYEEDDLSSKLAPDWLVGVGVNVPLVDRSGRGGKLHAAKSAANRIDHLHSQAESDLSVLVDKTYRQVLQALEEFEGLRSSRKLAEETLQLRVKAFSQGLSTSLDVVDAELFLARVKTQRAAAVHSYVIGLARLLAVSDRPEEFFTYQNNKGIEER